MTSPVHACSFCQQAHTDVEKLIAGPDDANICAACVTRLALAKQDPSQLRNEEKLVLWQREEKKQPPINCSFCGKARHEVNAMTVTPAVQICNECLDLCHEIVEGRRAREKGRASKPDGAFTIRYLYCADAPSAAHAEFLQAIESITAAFPHTPLMATSSKVAFDDLKGHFEEFTNEHVDVMVADLMDRSVTGSFEFGLWIGLFAPVCRSVIAITPSHAPVHYPNLVVIPYRNSKDFRNRLRAELIAVLANPGQPQFF